VREQRQAYERERSTTQTRQLYDGAWDRASKAWRGEHPLCRYCLLDDIVTPATLVDHFWPHRGDPDLFWNRLYWVESCDPCHSGMKQAVERAGIKAMHDLAKRLDLPPRG
jgi:5-methylcytosine-specific restriction protein A